MGPIKIYDLEGNIIKKLDNYRINTYFIDIYYDNKNSKIFILTCNDNSVQAFDYEQNSIYKIYKEEDDIFGSNHNCLIINDKEELIESSVDGIIRIWNFHSAILLNKIIMNQNWRTDGFCLWNNSYIFVSCDKIIKIIELKSGKTVEELKNHNKYISYIKIIIHPIYGECLISQGMDADGIKLWVFK